MINRLILAVYINDLLIAGKHEVNIIHIKQFLKGQLKIRDLAETYVILDIWMKRYSKQITLDESQYIAVIFKQFLNDIFPPYLIPKEPDAV